MVLQDSDNGGNDGRNEQRSERVPRAGSADALRGAVRNAGRVIGGLCASAARKLRAACSAMGKRWRIVTDALDPKASSNMDAQRVFRIRRAVVFSGMAVVVLVVALVVGICVHASRNAQSGKPATVSAAQSGRTGQSASANAAKKKSAAKKDTKTTAKATTKETTKETAKDQAKNETQKKLDALAASISGDESASIKAKADETAKNSGKDVKQYTYCIAGKGNVGSLDGFANTVYRVLNDPRGWPRAGATFVKGDGDACNFTVVLSEAKYMPTFDSGCSTEYSCRVDGNVIINLDRWNNGIGNWMKAGGDLARYRTMVINHEVGHALGHNDNENTCAGAEQSAPLMQEQSMHLDGCKVNEWPLDIELWKN